MKLIILTILIFEVLTVCPNYCSGHGTCSEDDVCTCFVAPGLDSSYFSHPQYVGSCPYGESFAAITNQIYNAIESNKYEDNSDENSRSLEEFSNSDLNLIDIVNYEVVEINGAYPLLGKAGGIMNCNRSSTNIYRSCQLNNLNVVARQENKFLIYWPEDSSITCNGTVEDSSENPILKEKEFLYNCHMIEERKDLSMMISGKINRVHNNNNIGVMSIDGISQILEYYNYNDNQTYNLACIYKEDTLQMKIYPAILYLYSQIEENTTINNEGEGEGSISTDKDDEYLISTTIQDNNNKKNINEKFNIPPPPPQPTIELPGSVAPTQSSSSLLNNYIKTQQKIKQQQQQQQQQQQNKRYLKEKLFENKIKSLSSIFNKPPPPTNYDFDINNRKLSENSNENKHEENEPKLSKFEKYLKLVDSEIVSGDNAIFVTVEPVLPEGHCFLLGDAKGQNITIDKTDLIKYLRFQNNKYYFGPNSNPNSAFSTINNGTAFELIEESDIEIFDEEFKNKSGVIFPLSQLFSQHQFKSSLLQLKTGNRITMMFLSPMSGVYMKIYTIVKVKFYNTNGDELDNDGNIIVNSRILQQQQQSKIMNPSEIYVGMITTPPFTPIDEDISFFFQIQSNSIHEFIECSGAGICNRNNGKCECFSGYDGIACQRLRCPNDCSNHGKCVTFDEAIKGSKYKNQIKQQFGYSGSNSLNEKFFGCLCENGYRGSDCSLKECPSFSDPQSDKDIKITKESRDCSGRGICNYDNGICECFNGYSGVGCEVIMPANY